MIRYRKRWFENDPGTPGPRFYRNVSVIAQEFEWASDRMRFRLAHRLADECRIASHNGVIYADAIGRRDVVVKPVPFTGRAAIFNKVRS